MSTSAVRHDSYQDFGARQRYSALFTLEHVPAAFIADGLARLQVRYPEIPVVFADSRKFAEEWTYRFLAAAFSDTESGDPVAERR
jgi:hypothetical protein